LIVDAAATRARTLGGGRIERDLAGLRVDLADILDSEVEEPDVVLLVGEDAVGGDALERIPGFVELGAPVVMFIL